MCSSEQYSVALQQYKRLPWLLDKMLNAHETMDSRLVDLFNAFAVIRSELELPKKYINILSV